MIYVVAFVPIKNDRLNLSFVKDEHRYGKKMARNGPTTVIYKGTFVSNQSLLESAHSFMLKYSKITV